MKMTASHAILESDLVLTVFRTIVSSVEIFPQHQSNGLHINAVTEKCSDAFKAFTMKAISHCKEQCALSW